MCGIGMAFGVPHPVELVQIGLTKEQHRGSQAAGLYAFGQSEDMTRKEEGLAERVTNIAPMETGRYNYALGQVRYTTHGEDSTENIQPIMREVDGVQLAVLHNGQLGHPENIESHRREMKRKGWDFKTGTDTENILASFHLAAGNTLEEKLKNAIPLLDGSGAIAGIYDTVPFAASLRGNRPIHIATFANGGHMIASEDYFFGMFDVVKTQSLQSGEFAVFRDGEFKYHTAHNLPGLRCIMEDVYFSMPGSTHNGEAISRFRRRSGALLAQEHPADADIIVPVMDSGGSAAMGYHDASGIRLEPDALIRTKYSAGRTFTANPDLIAAKVHMKFNATRSLVEGKSVVVVDDSIVRGNTVTGIVRMLQKAGAKEIHWRSASPPIISPCYYGINIKTEEELFATRHSELTRATELGVNSLGYLSLGNMLRAYEETYGLLSGETCTSCFTGNHWYRGAESLRSQ